MNIFVSADFVAEADERTAGRKVWRQVQAKIHKGTGWKPLSGPFAGLYRVRVGDYRCVFEVRDEDTVLVIALAHRREVYEITARRRA